jgi:hypothetical protein
LPIAVANVPERDLTSLTAVTFRPIIQKREEAFVLKRDCDHHYADRELFELITNLKLTNRQIARFCVGPSPGLRLLL